MESPECDSSAVNHQATLPPRHLGVGYFDRQLLEAKLKPGKILQPVRMGEDFLEEVNLK